MNRSHIRPAARAATQRPVKRDFALLALGMSAAIITTLVVIGGSLAGA